MADRLYAPVMVALPMSWHGTVGHLGGAGVDHGHVDQRLRTARVSVAVGFSPPPARSQRLLGKVAGEAAEVGSVHRLIDRLVHHVPFRVVRELDPQRLADLFRAPLLPQPVLHEAPQHRIPGDLAGPPAGAALHRKTVRRERSISTRFLVSIAPQLPADRRRTAAGPGRDVPTPCPARCRSAILIRSSSERNLGEISGAGVLITGA